MQRLDKKAIGLVLLLLIWTGQIPPSGAQRSEKQKNAPAADHRYPWLTDQPRDTVASRFSPPPGFRRIELPAGSFGDWLRHLPLEPGRPPVTLYDGSLKGNQEAHLAVVEMEIGDRDLQQCADAAMRLWAEHLWSTGRQNRICFRAAAGHRLNWRRWKKGFRPARGSSQGWQQTAAARTGRRAFRRYLDRVFGRANSASLLRQLDRVTDPRNITPGDLFVEGATSRGYGHVVIVVDVVVNARGARRFLLAQSYMPAQRIHILKNPQNSSSPWYPVPEDEPLKTPEWTFEPGILWRFNPNRC